MRTRRPLRSHRTGALVALLVVLAATLAPTTSSAQEGGDAGSTTDTTTPAPGPWSFSPTSPQSGPGRNWFILDMQPGQVLRDSVAVSNTTSEPLSFAIYTANAFNNENGGAFSIRPATEPKKDSAKWVTLATDAYTVQPGRKVVIPFEITVPSDASSGDHVAAIAAMDINPEGTTQSGGVSLDIKRVVGIRLYIRVAGAVSPGLKVDRLKVATDAPRFGIGGDPSGELTYRVTNTGNTTLSPTSVATVSGGLGGPDLKLKGKKVRELLPGNSIVVKETWKGLPVIGPVTVKATAASPGDDVSASAATTTWIVPWPLLLLLAIVLIVVVGLLVRRRKRRKATVAPTASPPAAAREPEPVSS